MIIDKQFLDTLSAQAKANPRLRQNYDLRNSENDNSQRMLNALEPGTIMPIHRHLFSSETVVIIRGSLVERFYDDDGNVTEEVIMKAGGDNPVLNIEKGRWHTLECLEPDTVLFESKDGKYEPLKVGNVMDLSLIGAPQKVKTNCCELYQQLCDKVFGADAVTIKVSKDDNNVIGTLKYIHEFRNFKENFQARLERLRDKFQGTSSYNALLEQVKQVADPSNWEGAYAELVAYDVLHNGYHGEEFLLDVTLDGAESYASDLGGQKTNEDGYLPDYDLYFDVKCLADTTGNILKELINDALKQAGVEKICGVLPEYPLDDDESDYSINRHKLMVELRDYINASRPTDDAGTDMLKSNILPNLTYRILWGGGVNSALGEYSPYEHAEKTKDLMLKRYTKKFLKKHESMIVLVNFPWYNNRIHPFIDGDEMYYRALARRTFCGYKYSTVPMKDINPKYTGSETPYEISRHLSGIMIIDDHSIETDTYSCHVYLNPNAVNPIKYGRSYLHQVVQDADKRSIIDDFRGDNY